MSSLTVTSASLQLVGSKNRFLQLVKRNEQYCPSCDGFGLVEYNFGDELISTTCNVCTEFTFSSLEVV